MRGVLRGIDHHLDRIHAARERIAAEGREMASHAEIEREAKRPTAPAETAKRPGDEQAHPGTV